MLAKINKILVFILLILSILLVGFTLFSIYTERDMQRFTQPLFDEICLNGVIYYKSNHTLAPKFSQNGQLTPCEF